MKDGTYRVVTSYFVAGFEIRGGQLRNCAPILRNRIAFWKTIAVWIDE